MLMSVMHICKARYKLTFIANRQSTDESRWPFVNLHIAVSFVYFRISSVVKSCICENLYCPYHFFRIAYSCLLV